MAFQRMLSLSEPDVRFSPRNTCGRLGALGLLVCLAGCARSGVDDDATCDSEPGAGDGWCDACAITGGESTENEMFLIPGGPRCR